jgi:hypothetical protein
MANQRADEIPLRGFIGIGATGVIVRLNDDVVVVSTICDYMSCTGKCPWLINFCSATVVIKLPRICKDPEATPE